MVNPFDLRTALLAKHAQHVVLIHFPIALFIAAVAFDFVGQWSKRTGFADATYYNLLAAAISTFPVLATGILAWQLQLEGQKLKGMLLLHLVLACVTSATIWLVWWLHFRDDRSHVGRCFDSQTDLVAAQPDDGYHDRITKPNPLTLFAGQDEHTNFLRE
jgi:hypothetical protein